MHLRETKCPWKGCFAPFLGVRGDGVVRRNGRRKRRMDSNMFSSHSYILRANHKGTEKKNPVSKNTIVNDRFPA